MVEKTSGDPLLRNKQRLIFCGKRKFLTVFSLSVLTQVAQSETFSSDLAFPGYSGYFNVPSAWVLPHGNMSVQYSDQGFFGKPEQRKNTRYEYAHNVAGTFGVFNNIELGGRLIWGTDPHANCFDSSMSGRCEIRDLSSNIKVQVPFIPENWFSIAVGKQDIGGEVNFFDSTYAVVGKRAGPVELSVGYGTTKLENRYLDGVFGGVSYHPLPWLNLIGEYDSRNVRIGAGLATPEHWLPHGMQLKLKVLAADEGDDDNDRFFSSIGISVPFGNATKKQHLNINSDEEERLLSPGKLSSKDTTKVAGSPGVEYPVSPQTHQFNDEVALNHARQDEARAVGKRLARSGYERVKVASSGESLTVQWENNIFNRDERDSIHDVAQIVWDTCQLHDKARLVLLNQGIKVSERTIALSDKGITVQGSIFSGSNVLAKEEEINWDYQGGFGATWKPRVTLSPTLSSTVGTEYGVWDYSLGLSAETAMSLWKGALISGTYNTELDSSRNFEEGGYFYNSRQRDDLVEAEFQQTFKLHSLLYTSFHAGRYAYDYQGFLNETVILAPNGRHSLGYLGGSFSRIDELEDDRDESLIRYSYYNPDLGFQVNAYAGQFFAEDTGFRIDSRFWFGDYAITLTYKDTDAQFVGLGWVIPLTPVRDHQFRYLQVKGNPDWNYAVQTRVNDYRNYLSFGGAAILRSANPIQYLYLNRGRLPNR